MLMKGFEIPGLHIQRFDSFSLLESMLCSTEEACRVTVCTYAVTEGWLRRLALLKRAGKISAATLVLDYTVMIRHREKLPLLRGVCDQVYLTNSHAKLMLVEGCAGFQATAVCSANATNNYRIESYYVSNRTTEVNALRDDLRGILQGAVRIIGG